MKRIVLLLMMVVAFAATADAQGFLKRLKDRALNSAENAISNKVDSKIYDETNDAMDDVLDGKKSKKSKSNDDADEEEAVAEDAAPAAKQKKSAKGEEVKSDFVPGTVVIFEDNLQGEQMGEFPSKWDLIENNAEVAKMNGKMAIKFEHGSNTEIMPLIKDGNKKYLPEFYTLEFDFFATGKEDTNTAYRLYLNSENDRSTSVP